MSLYAPIEDPSESGSLLDRTFEQVRQNPFLRVLLVITLIDDAAAVLLAFLMPGEMQPVIAGSMILMSTLAWVFAVGLPTMNRELRSQARTVRWAYLSGLVEMFGRVVLCAVVFIFTAALVTVVT